MKRSKDASKISKLVFYVRVRYLLLIYLLECDTMLTAPMIMGADDDDDENDVDEVADNDND